MSERAQLPDQTKAPEHTQDCLDQAFIFHAATGGDADCICDPCAEHSNARTDVSGPIGIADDEAGDGSEIDPGLGFDGAGRKRAPRGR